MNKRHKSSLTTFKFAADAIKCNKNHLMLKLGQFETISFVGNIFLTLINGKIEINGYEMSNNTNKTVEIYSNIWNRSNIYQIKALEHSIITIKKNMKFINDKIPDYLYHTSYNPLIYQYFIPIFDNYDQEEVDEVKNVVEGLCDNDMMDIDKDMINEEEEDFEEEEFEKKKKKKRRKIYVINQLYYSYRMV